MKKHKIKDKNRFDLIQNIIAIPSNKIWHEVLDKRRYDTKFSSMCINYRNIDNINTMKGYFIRLKNEIRDEIR